MSTSAPVTAFVGASRRVKTRSGKSVSLTTSVADAGANPAAETLKLTL